MTPPRSAPSNAGLAPGELVAGRYRLGPVIGRGGMADVYDGFDERLERPVAVKFLRPEMAVRDDIRIRFEAEARAAAGLSHPNAVAVFDTGEHGGVPFLVMERLPGETLADRIAAGPVDPAWLCRAASGVLGALAAAHAAGIVHRDVKPGNILIAADGTAKIADFGIAKSLPAGDGTGGAGGTRGRHSDLTATGQLLGTPAYLAPERLEGVPASARSDLWALGVVLYEALAGRKPFDGASPLAVARAVAQGDHAPLATVRPDLDPRLVATVERAMAPHPADRFAGAAEMAAALAGPRAAPGEAPTLDGRPDGTLVLPTSERPVAASAPTAATPTAAGTGPGATAPPAPPGPSPTGPAQAGPAPSGPARPLRPARSRRAAGAPWSGRKGLGWALAIFAVVALLVLLTRTSGPSIDAVARQAESTVASTTPTTKAPATTVAPAPESASQLLRALADRLKPSDGARAGDLAAGLRQVANDLDAGSPATVGHATALIISAAAWQQTGQLSTSALTAAVQLLQAVPGVQATAAAPAPTVATTVAAPRTGATGATTTGGKGKAKGKD